MPKVHTTDPDGEPVSFDPLEIMTAITDGTLRNDPDAETVAGALVLGWIQEIVKRHPEAPGGDQFLKMKAPDFVNFLKTNPEAVRLAVQQFQESEPVRYAAINGQRRMWGWRSPHR